MEASLNREAPTVTPRRTRLAIAGALTAAIALTGCAADIPDTKTPKPNPTNTAQRAEVPDIVGRTAPDAEDTLRAAGFKIGQVTLTTEGPTSGIVVNQSVPAGKSKPVGSLIDITVVSRQTGVPSVAGLSRIEAEKVLEQAGFRVGDVRSAKAGTPAGTVYAQSPAAGDSAPQGTLIDLRLSNGKAGLVDVLGLPRAAAEHALLDAGMEIIIRLEPSESLEGLVIGQSPRAGEKIDPGSAVTVVVSTGSEQT